MKKIKPLSPEQALQFLDDFHRLSHNVDETTTAISLRIPQNILRAIKFKAQSKEQKYQSLIIKYLREGLRRDENTN